MRCLISLSLLSVRSVNCLLKALADSLGLSGDLFAKVMELLRTDLEGLVRLRMVFHTCSPPSENEALSMYSSHLAFL